MLTLIATVQVHVKGTWSSDATRQFMMKQIGLIAGELTLTAHNCYWLIGHRLCNLGDRITINFPPVNGKTNHMSVKFFGPFVLNEFRCCPTRKIVDSVLDRGADESKKLFGKDKFDRLTKCIIWGWVDCNDCGYKCDTCGAVCDDVCPAGKC